MKCGNSATVPSGAEMGKGREMERITKLDGTEICAIESLHITTTPTRINFAGRAQIDVEPGSSETFIIESDGKRYQVGGFKIVITNDETPTFSCMGVRIE